MAFLEAAGDFTDLTASDFNAKLLTLDAENVLTGYGDSRIRDEALNLIVSTLLSEESPYVAVATNNRSRDYVRGLEEQLPPSVRVLSGLDYENKKTSPEMFLAALALYDVKPNEAMHIDDQLLSFRGAKAAGFKKGILVKPFGSSGHVGVKIGRAIDRPVRVGLLAVDGARNLYRDGIDG